MTAWMMRTRPSPRVAPEIHCDLGEHSPHHDLKTERRGRLLALRLHISGPRLSDIRLVDPRDFLEPRLCEGVAHRLGRQEETGSRLSCPGHGVDGRTPVAKDDIIDHQPSAWLQDAVNGPVEPDPISDVHRDVLCP